MRHGRAGFKLKRNVAARDSLLRGLVTSVIEEERIVTTVPKAKAAKPLVEKMITLAKEDTLHARRKAAAFLRTPDSVKKLFDKLGTRFGQRNGGYTRIVKLGQRKSDSASMAFIEWVDAAQVIEEKEPKEKPAKKQKEAAPPLKEEAAPKAEEPKSKKRKWFGKKSKEAVN